MGAQHGVEKKMIHAYCTECEKFRDFIAECEDRAVHECSSCGHEVPDIVLMTSRTTTKVHTGEAPV